MNLNFNVKGEYDMFEQVYAKEGKPYCTLCGNDATCRAENNGRMLDFCKACALGLIEDQVNAEFEDPAMKCDFCNSIDGTTMRVYDRYPCGIDIRFLCNGCNEDQVGQGFDRAASMRPSYEYRQPRGNVR